MSTVKHVPVGEPGDEVGTVRLCDCCHRPWILRRNSNGEGTLQKFFGSTVPHWTPETLRERLARRWWQFKLRFKRTPEWATSRPLIPGAPPLWTTITETTEITETVVSEEMKKKVWEE